MSCASDGTIFFPAYAIPSPPSYAVSFSVYGVRYAGSFVDSVHYDPALATDLRRIFPTDAIAASDTRVVISVNAITADEDAKDRANNAKTPTRPFLLFYDRKGNFLYSASLDIDFPVGALGIFESGNLLLVGAPDFRERHRHWAVVDDHGRFVRNLQPGTEGDEEKKVGDLKEFAKTATLPTGAPHLMPYRGHLLLIEMNTDSPVKEINEGGIVKATTLQLPKGEKSGQFIPSDGRNWMVDIGHADAAGPEGAGLMPPASFSLDKIAEFNPETGELLRYIDPGSKHYAASITCEHDGTFTTLSEGPNDGSLILETATTE